MAKGGRARVLLLAYACSPSRGSEPAAGWHRAVEIAKRHDTWVLCKQQDYEADIIRYFASHPQPAGLHFVFVPLTRLELLLRCVPGLWYLAYNLWHRRACRRGAELHRRVGFDLTHQVTLAGFREPGYLWKLGVPFVWGPVGGTQNYPWRFLPRAGLRGALKEGLRNLVNTLQFRFSPRVAAAARRASVLLAANSTAQRDFERVHRAHSTLMPNVGATPPMTGLSRPPREGNELRLLWSGVIEPHKALHLLIQALAGLPQSLAYELRILGRGKLEARLHELAQRCGVADRCTWMGWMPHEDALRQYEWADLFVLTSLRDTSPAVVMEALSHGVPVLCLDHQGAGDVVTPACGVKVPVTSPEEVVSAIRAAIVAFVREPGALKAMRSGAIGRAREYQWSAQGDRIAELYGQVLRRAHEQAGADAAPCQEALREGGASCKGSVQGEAPGGNSG